MKKSLIAICLLVIFIPLNCYAKNIAAGCKTCSEFAGMIMLFRQYGIESSFLVKIVYEDKETSKEVKKFMEDIIREAYKYPKVSEDELKVHIINFFKNEMFLRCMKKYNR